MSARGKPFGQHFVAEINTGNDAQVKIMDGPQTQEGEITTRELYSTSGMEY